MAALTQETEKSLADLLRFDPCDLQLGLKAYPCEAEEEDFFDAVMLLLFKKLAAGHVEAAFPRDSFEALCSLASDEKLFRALTREIRAFFHEAAADSAKKQPLLVASIGLVELYFEACAKAADEEPFGCWAFCQEVPAEAALRDLSPRLAYSLEAFDFESKLGYSGFLWFRLAAAGSEVALLELSFKTRIEQLVAVGVRDKKLFVRFGRQEVQLQLDAAKNHLLGFCVSLQDSACQVFLDGHSIFRCERLLQGFSPIDSELRVTLLSCFAGRLNSYFACYGCDVEASLAVHREVGLQGIQSCEQLSLLHRLLKNGTAHKTISPVCESKTC